MYCTSCAEREIKILDDPDAALAFLRTWTQWPIRPDRKSLEVVLRSKNKELHQMAVNQLEGFVPNKFWVVAFREDCAENHWDYCITVSVQSIA